MSKNLGEDVSLCHNGEYEGILTVGELTRLVWVLPRVVFLNYIFDHYSIFSISENVFMIWIFLIFGDNGKGLGRSGERVIKWNLFLF